MTLSKVKFALLLTIAFGVMSSIIDYNSGNNCSDGFCQLSGVYAAQISRGPVAPTRDPALEKESAHHLDVAWQYFKRKLDKKDGTAITRANKTIADRLNEVIDTNPNFAKLDEVYYLLGETYLRDPDEKVSSLAEACYKEIVKNFTDSKFIGDAKKRLDEINSSSAKKSEDKNEGKKKS